MSKISERRRDMQSKENLFWAELGLINTHVAASNWLRRKKYPRPTEFCAGSNRKPTELSKHNSDYTLKCILCAVFFLVPMFRMATPSAERPIKVTETSMHMR